MKAIIKFKLPEEQEEYALFTQAPALYNALDSISNMLRDIIKAEGAWGLDLATVEIIRDKFYNKLRENGLEL